MPEKRREIALFGVSHKIGHQILNLSYGLAQKQIQPKSERQFCEVVFERVLW